MKDKILEFLDKSVTNQMLLKRIAFYLFFICVLLGLIFFKLNEINKNIISATEPIILSYNSEKEEKVADVFTEDEFSIGDKIPLYNDIENTSSVTENQNNTQSIINTTENTTENKHQTETSTESSTTISDISQKYNYVININSKKIHYADCTFVNRMKEENRKYIQLNEKELNEHLNNGYSLCSSCGG